MSDSAFDIGEAQSTNPLLPSTAAPQLGAPKDETESATESKLGEGPGDKIKEIKRNTAPLPIEEQIGCVFEEFKCQHNNFAGILYVGPLGVVFLGRFLLFEWTVVLKWEDVTKVRRTAHTPGCASVESTVVQIETRGTTEHQERGTYDFHHFFDSHKVLEVLITLHNDSILGNGNDNGNGGAATHHTSRRSFITRKGLLRSNSDPTRISELFNFDDPPLVVTAGSWDDDDEDQNAMADLRKQYAAGKDKNNQTFSTNGSGGHNPSGVRRQSCDGNENGNENVNENVNEQNDDTNNHSMSEDELRAEWEKVYGDLETCPEVAVRDRELMPAGGDLDVFFRSFLSNDASFPLGRYMTEVVGDSGVEATEWIDSAEDGSSSSSTGGIRVQTRTIDYTHPVNAPMAPPQARARKEQTLRHYGNKHGLVIETKTIVNDVPMTDCFYVRDVLRVERTSDDRLVLNIRFGLVFVKSTMFRSLITRTTNGEFHTFMGNMADFIGKNCCGGGTAPAPAPAPPAIVAEKPPLPPTTEDALSPPSRAILVPPVRSDAKVSALPSESPAKIATGNSVWKMLSVLLLLWIGFQQTRVLSELQSFRHELKEWKQLQLQLQQQTTCESTTVPTIE